MQPLLSSAEGYKVRVLLRSANDRNVAPQEAQEAWKLSYQIHLVSGLPDVSHKTEPACAWTITSHASEVTGRLRENPSPFRPVYIPKPAVSGQLLILRSPLVAAITHSLSLHFG